MKLVVLAAGPCLRHSPPRPSSTLALSSVPNRHTRPRGPVAAERGGQDGAGVALALLAEAATYVGRRAQSWLVRRSWSA